MTEPICRAGMSISVIDKFLGTCIMLMLKDNGYCLRHEHCEGFVINKMQPGKKLLYCTVASAFILEFV